MVANLSLNSIKWNLCEVYLAIEPHSIPIVRRTDGDGGDGAEVIGIESYADAVVYGEDTDLVSLSPILDHSDVRRGLSRHHVHPFLRRHRK